MTGRTRAIVTVLGLLIAGFILQQVYLFVVTGESLIAVRNVQITIPEAYDEIMDILVATNDLMLEGGNLELPDCNDLVASRKVPGLMNREGPAFRAFGICELWSENTGEVYLYSGRELKQSWPYEYRGEKYYYVRITSMAVKENPKGVYHGYSTKYGEEKWVIAAVLGRAMVESPIPPVPGCMYCPDRYAVYFPKSILPVLRMYYPNVRVPEDLIIPDP